MRVSVGIPERGFHVQLAQRSQQTPCKLSPIHAAPVPSPTQLTPAPRPRPTIVIRAYADAPGAMDIDVRTAWPHRPVVRLAAVQSL